MSAPVSQAEQLQLLDKLQVFKFQGCDKHGRKILRILAKLFPARVVSVEVVNKYLAEKIYPRLEKVGPFSILYVHTDVERAQNFPGISALRCIYDQIPASIRLNLQSLYFLHPGLQSRLFLATFGRLFFSGRVYEKVKYVRRVDTLWEHIRRNEIEVPEFVKEHDEELEFGRTMEYGLESDHPRRVCAAAPLSLDSPVPMYSMRCIS